MLWNLILERIIFSGGILRRLSGQGLLDLAVAHCFSRCTVLWVGLVLITQGLQGTPYTLRRMKVSGAEYSSVDGCFRRSDHVDLIEQLRGFAASGYWVLPSM